MKNRLLDDNYFIGYNIFSNYFVIKKIYIYDLVFLTNLSDVLYTVYSINYPEIKLKCN